ncbi:transcriptional regulator, LuxR family [Sphingobium chlorophenolicum L-1]|uniref:Transcriptional regulator, LuxR family n=1 Tax=Sphingobium chlorophenolicum L-1 TaxID=690566 RepID=F6F337_SPHCR|nr:helix-turn-helix transcriptional regulator [Sphingobium chlorophenolicum]AEG50849.1 transcriptional regulator, LuxR family [Sphingobium chlorophenolicum L-1]
MVPRDISKIRIRSVADIRSAAVYFREVMKAAANLRIAATENIATRAPMLDGEGALLATTVFGWSGAQDVWWDDRRFALKTPLAEACRIEGQPFWADASGAWNEQGKRILAHLDFSYFGKMVAHPASIVVPVHLPFSRIGMVALSCFDNLRADLSAELKRHYYLIHLLSHFFINDYAHLSRKDRWLPTWAALTPLEVSCLRWIGRGKTDDEVAAIMGRARPTIRFHLQNAAKKLGAVNRTQAVFLAAQLGFLSAPSGHPGFSSAEAGLTP